MNMTVNIGGTDYYVSGNFKPAGLSVSEKFLRLMEKELEISEELCYNNFKPQKSMDCKLTQGGIA